MKSFIIFALFFLSVFTPSLTASESKYSETIAVLQESYNGEVMANRKYLAYAQKAESENYPNIAYLFIIFCMSDTWLYYDRDPKRYLSDMPGPDF
ncbi:MAG: hypothetical protein KKD90_06320 [Candidatus Omnitrophica bacterium]|nr:hypothetical protein [Candidatus Omnitrophota bacterium]